MSARIPMQNILLRASFDIYESTLWEVRILPGPRHCFHLRWRGLYFPPIKQILWLGFAFAWGTGHLFATRNLAGEAEKGTSEENTWGFGQVFPVILLALPIYFRVDIDLSNYYQSLLYSPGEICGSTCLKWLCTLEGETFT